MAIHSPKLAAEPQPIDIESWTEEATAALTTVTISAPDSAEAPAATVTTDVELQIPLDDVSTSVRFSERPAAASAAAKQGGQYKRQELLRRDSLKRREALLKGKEGSRRRMRWENGMLGFQTTPPGPGSITCMID